GPNSPAPTAADSVPSAASPGPSRPEGPNSSKTSRFATVPTAAGTFSPRRPILRLDGHGYSPAVLRMIVTAGTRVHSFADAAFAVGLCGVPISARHVQQLTEEVGADLARARAAQAEMRRRRTLTPRVASTPPAVVVEVDGGRVRTRATGCGPGVHEAEGKEDKIACLATWPEVATGEDPCPEPPPSFVEPRRIQRLVQQMSQKSGEAVTPGATSDEAFSPEAATPGAEPWSPRRRGRTCVASLTDSRSLGPLGAAEAQSRDFFAAPRRAVVADGQAYNGTIHRGYFADLEPTVDLLHVVGYLFGAARAAGRESEGWPWYVRWLRSCWQGQVAAVIAEMAEAQERLGRPPPEELA